ncbi:MAG: hemolysin III family protein [Caulobacteraceae bacterium]|nr:hemolysin III family protein [Caulobacteraceae bacterium]
MLSANDLSDLLPKLHYPTRLEKLVDGWVHGVALGVFTFAVGAALGLAIWQGGLPMASAVAVYAICVMTMIGCSMAYNLAENHKRKSLLRRFDHAAIFLMIAGTYTPFTTIRFDGAWAISMTTIIWALALIGAAGKLFLPGIGKKIWIAFYVLMGWLVVAAMGPMIEGVPLAASSCSPSAACSTRSASRSTSPKNSRSAALSGTPSSWPPPACTTPPY